MTGKLKDYIEKYGDGVVIEAEKGVREAFVPLRKFLKEHDIPFVKVAVTKPKGLTDHGGHSFYISNAFINEHPYISGFMGNNVMVYGKAELDAQYQRKAEQMQRAKEKRKTIKKYNGFVYYRGTNPTWEQATRNELNDKSTKSESDAYRWIAKRFGKNQVVRQHPVRVEGRLFYLDIFIKKGNVAVEVDGGYHFTPEQQAADAERTRLLNSVGIQVLRITNEDVKDRHKLKCFATEVRFAVERNRRVMRELRNTSNGGI